MKKNKIYLIFAVVCVVIVIIIASKLGNKSLDLKSNQVSKLYSYLGEVDIYHCGGLNTYSDKTIIKDDISLENTLCMAYYNMDKTKVEKKATKYTEKNKNDVKICKVGENTTLATKENSDECEYIIIKKADLNKAYYTIYGEDIKEYSKFYITSSEACFLEGNNYYCGEADTFTYSLTPQATIYRLMNKAVKQLNGDIIIYDYFLKETDNKCYTKNSYQEESSDCTSALSKNNKIDKAFLKKYGSIYKHTFKKDSNNEYHWIKTEINN